MVLILSPSLADKQVILSSERLLSAQQEGEEPAEGNGSVVWSEAEGEELNQGLRLKIQHPKVRKPPDWLIYSFVFKPPHSDPHLA